MNKKYLLLVALLFLFLFCAQNVQAANQAELTTSVSSDGFSYAITQGQPLPPITFRLWETTHQYNTQIMLYTDGLTAQSGANSISEGAIKITYQEGQDASQLFTLRSGEIIQINVTIDTPNAQPGTYTGKITVYASNATSLAIPLKIQIGMPIIWPAALNLAGVLLGFAFVILGITIPPAAKDRLEAVKNALTWSEIRKNWGPVLAFILMTFVVWAGAFVAYYPKTTVFGASSIDYAAAFLFGLGQVGAAKVTADMFKGKPDAPPSNS